MSGMPDDIKEVPGYAVDLDSDMQKGEISDDDHEVFRNVEGQVNFRTVSWIRASIIFLKFIFATGVLSIPSLMYELGALPGALVVVGWTVLNGYMAIVQGNFHIAHPECHSIADMANVMGGPILKEAVGLLFIIAYVMCVSSAIITVSTAFNALSLHSICTMWFSFVSAVIVCAFASVRKFSHIGWLTWIGFASIYIAVLIVVIGVTTRDRPAAAPQTGDFDLGWVVVGSPSFESGITAAATIFVSSAGTSAFLPVMAEMRRPKDYNKAVYLCMTLVTASYLAFSLVMYAWCGKWIASPSLGSAGTMIKRVAYGIALPGLIVSGSLYVHVAAKYLFVRFLRNTPHFQANTWVHWATWLSCTIGSTIIAFILAGAIPIFNYIIALVGSLCFGPLAIILPASLWLYSHTDYWRGNLVRQVLYGLHVLLALLGLFMTIGGTYGTIVEIIDAYDSGLIASAFSCADNSGSS